MGDRYFRRFSEVMDDIRKGLIPPGSPQEATVSTQVGTGVQCLRL